MRWCGKCFLWVWLSSVNGYSAFDWFLSFLTSPLSSKPLRAWCLRGNATPSGFTYFTCLANSEEGRNGFSIFNSLLLGSQQFKKRKNWIITCPIYNSIWITCVIYDFKQQNFDFTKTCVPEGDHDVWHVHFLITSRIVTHFFLPPTITYRCKLFSSPNDIQSRIYTRGVSMKMKNYDEFFTNKYSSSKTDMLVQFSKIRGPTCWGRNLLK